MAVPAITDLKLYRSSQTNSDGGTISATEIVSAVNNTLFPALGGGAVVYRKIFIKNTHATATVPSPLLTFLAALPSSDQEKIEIAVGTSSDTTAPTTWYLPTTITAAISLGSLAPAASVALWLKQTSIPYTVAASTVPFTVRFDYPNA